MITGAWATCSPVGNIIGLQISVLILNYQGRWEYQMYYIGAAYFMLSALLYKYFIASPLEVGLTIESEVIDDDNFVKEEGKDEERINFMAALKAPYVVLYGWCFFCVKFAVYAVLLWMPMYLKEVR